MVEAVASAGGSLNSTRFVTVPTLTSGFDANNNQAFRGIFLISLGIFLFAYLSNDLASSARLIHGGPMLQSKHLTLFGWLLFIITLVFFL
jgi:hypothetical protein